MDLQKMIAELQAERDRLDHAILALERLSRHPNAKRGRPPKWLTDLNRDDPPSAPEAVKVQTANGRK
jgi:hypothetical protein